jgi:hypothetical protein
MTDKPHAITCIGERGALEEPLREWRTEHCINCMNMRKDPARDPWGDPGNSFCKAYGDYLGKGVWMFILTVGCKGFKKDPRKNCKI